MTTAVSDGLQALQCAASTCSRRVRFVFNSKKLPSEEVKLNLFEGDQLKSGYLKLNPNGVVPTRRLIYWC